MELAPAEATCETFLAIFLGYSFSELVPKLLRKQVAVLTLASGLFHFQRVTYISGRQKNYKFPKVNSVRKRRGRNCFTFAPTALSGLGADNSGHGFLLSH